MNIKRLVVLALTIAISAGTARSKDEYTLVRIQCSNPSFHLHFPKHIGANLKFELVSPGEPVGPRTDKVTIAAAPPLISCHSIKYGSDFSNLSAYYHYTVKRTVLGCTSVPGNPAAVDCKVQP